MNQQIASATVKSLFEEGGRLYQHRIRDLSLLRRLTDSVRLDIPMSDAIEFILEIIIDQLDIARVDLLLIDDAGQPELRGTRTSECVRDTEFSRNRSLSLAREVLASGTPMLANQAGQLIRPQYDDNRGSLLCLPLSIREHTVGVLALSYGSSDWFHESDVHSLLVVANQVALSLDNNHNYNRVMEAKAELEGQVQERTRHLEAANEKLAQSQSSLVESERLRALGQMASGVAHDFNNTLTGIMANAQFLLDAVPDLPLQERLKAVELAAKDGAATVRRIQEFSGTQVSREQEPIDLNDVVSDTITVTKPIWKDQAERGGVRYSIDARLGEVTAVIGAASELREAISNLILNALDAMPDGGRITLATWQEDDKVCLAVSDTGTGMTEEVRAKVFEPFFTTKGPANSGLGLSEVFGIMTRHNAELEVDSIEGHGSTFLVKLKASPLMPAVLNDTEPESGGRARILLVDDDSGVRDAVSMLLERLGHQVTTAGGGEEALELMSCNTFDLVFTDLGMPRMSGWEVASGVKDLNPVTPVILVTGWGREITEQELEDTGVDFLLPKPFEVKEAARVVAQALKLNAEQGAS